MPAPSPTLEDRRAAAIARAEQGLVMLGELAIMGMALSKEIAVRFIDGPYHPEPRIDPGRAFAASSRAVRLTIVLQGKLDAQIIALCNGDAATIEALSAPTVFAPGAARVGGRGDDAEDHHDHEADSRDTQREGLVEREHDTAMSGDDFAGCVNVIRADLGLEPNYSEPPEADEATTPIVRPDAARLETPRVDDAAAHAAAARAEGAARDIRPHPRQ